MTVAAAQYYLTAASSLQDTGSNDKYRLLARTRGPSKCSSIAHQTLPSSLYVALRVCTLVLFLMHSDCCCQYRCTKNA